jgi:hypothetical protein
LSLRLSGIISNQIEHDRFTIAAAGSPFAPAIGAGAAEKIRSLPGTFAIDGIHPGRSPFDCRPFNPRMMNMQPLARVTRTARAFSLANGRQSTFIEQSLVAPKYTE